MTANLTLTARLDQLAVELDTLNTLIRGLILDPKFLNQENRDFQDILKQRAALEVRMWTLKSNW